MASLHFPGSINPRSSGMVVVMEMGTDLPHGEMAAYELVIWLVLMEASTSPFKSQMWMLVSLEALMMNFPEKRTHRIS